MADATHTAFGTKPAAAETEHSLRATIGHHVQRASPTSVCREAARVIGGVLSAWGPILAGDEKNGGEIALDKLAYGYTANWTIRLNHAQPSSLEYQLVGNLTREFSNHDVLTTAVAQSVIEAATKVREWLVHLVDGTAGSNSNLLIGLEFERALSPELARRISPPKSSRSSKKRKADELDLDDSEAGGRPDVNSPTPIKRKGKTTSTAQTKLDSFFARGDSEGTPTPTAQKARGRGNFDHGVAVKWNYEERYWVEQQLRSDPDMPWPGLAASLNQRFQGTLFYAGKKGMVQRRTRSLQAIRQRFGTFRKKMQARKQSGEPTEGTTSDIEPEGDSDLSYDEMSLQGSDVAEEGYASLEI